MVDWLEFQTVCSHFLGLNFFLKKNIKKKKKKNKNNKKLTDFILPLSLIIFRLQTLQKSK